MHRPYVDNITLSCPKCNGKMSRVEEVIDVWFDSGSMPFAQHHYPFDNQKIFNQHFPADFIAEGVDQTRLVLQFTSNFYYSKRKIFL